VPQLPIRFPYAARLATLPQDLKAGRLEGSASDLLPGAVLFCITRGEATGRLSLDGESGPCSFGFRAGRIHQVEGGKGIFDGLEPAVGPAGSLSEGLALAFKAGHPAQRVMRAAMDGVGRLLARRACDLEGRLCFEAGLSPARGSFPLEHDAIRLLDGGLREAGSVPTLQAALRRHGRETLQVNVPAGIPEALWGFDAMTLRIFHMAPSCGTFEDLLILAAGDQAERRKEAMHRLYLLFCIGMLSLSSSSTSVVPRAPAPRQAESAPVAETRPGSALADALKKLSDMHHIARLGLSEAKKQPTIDEIGVAFRSVSRQYHPDGFAKASVEERHLAAACFAYVQESHQALQDPEVLGREWQRVECERHGIPYVSPEDATKARVAFKKAEFLIRNKEYEIAEACLGEAMRLDPACQDYAHQHAYIAFLSHQMTGEEAVARLDAIVPRNPAFGATVQVTAANILHLSQAPPDVVLARFRAALKLDAGNRDAERGVRMHTPKNERPSTTPPTPSIFSKFFGPKGNKPKGR
jgi:hypothetical protein